jgi:hypothetical protein
MSKRTSENNTAGQTATKKSKPTITDRMATFLCGNNITNQGSSPTNNPKVILISTGRDKYNMETMTRSFFDKHGFNLWTLPDKHVDGVRVGDIVLRTCAGDDNYTDVYEVSVTKFIPKEVYYDLYKPIVKQGHAEQKDYRNYIMVLTKRQVVRIPKNFLHGSLGFKGLQSTHPLMGHFTGKFSKTSVPHKWCVKNNIDPSVLINYYNSMRLMCITSVHI